MDPPALNPPALISMASFGKTDAAPQIQLVLGPMYSGKVRISRGAKPDGGPIHEMCLHRGADPGVAASLTSALRTTGYAQPTARQNPASDAPGFAFAPHCRSTLICVSVPQLSPPTHRVVAPYAVATAAASFLRS